MTDTTTPARRRAEAAFARLTHATTPLQRATEDARSDADARAEKTRRLRSARLERERHTQPAATKSKTKPEGTNL